LEVSFFSYQPSGFSQPIPYTDEGYMKLGRNLARTFLDYYKLQNYIVIKPTNVIKNNEYSHANNSLIKTRKLSQTIPNKTVSNLSTNGTVPVPQNNLEKNDSNVETNKSNGFEVDDKFNDGYLFIQIIYFTNIGLKRLR
jgi:hypothetical protein